MEKVPVPIQQKLSVSSRYLVNGYQQLEGLYERDLLRAVSCFDVAVASCNAADMAAFHVEKKAYMDIIDHTKDLLTGGDGYHCWLSSNKKQNLCRNQDMSTGCTAAAAAATGHDCQSITVTSHSRQGHAAAGSSSGAQSASINQQGHRRVHMQQSSSVPAVARTASQLLTTVQPQTSPRSRTQRISNHSSGHHAYQRGPVGVVAASDSRPTASTISDPTGCRTATVRHATQMDTFQVIEPLPGVPDGRAFLASSAAAFKARQQILDLDKHRQQLLHAHHPCASIIPEALSSLAARYQHKLGQPLRKLATAMGCLTLAQKRTYADNHSTSEWMREPWVHGRRRRTRINKRDILNPWDKKPASKVLGEDGYGRKAPTAPQIAPSTLRIAATEAAAEARSDALAAAKLRAAAAEQCVRQAVPHGTSLMHKVLFRCCTAVGVAAARVGLLKPQMENTVTVPAKLGTGGYLKQPRSGDTEALEQVCSWDGPRSEASCMKMDELRLRWQLQQLRKQEKRLTAQLAVAKMSGLFKMGGSSSAQPVPDAPTLARRIDTLKQQLQQSEASRIAAQLLLQQFCNNLKHLDSQLAFGPTADQCGSVADPLGECWDDNEPHYQVKLNTPSSVTSKTPQHQNSVSSLKTSPMPWTAPVNSTKASRHQQGRSQARLRGDNDVSVQYGWNRADSMTARGCRKKQMPGNLLELTGLKKPTAWSAAQHSPLKGARTTLQLQSRS